MESAQLLDILGNGNRRKILQLLASRPCYMSEIAERLDVGPKAVLGHLELLVRAGLIEASVDEQRRKYFHISDNLRMEVYVSPYSFEVETTVINVGVPPEHHARTSALNDLRSMHGDVQQLMERRQQITQEYQDLQARLTETMGKCMDAIEDVAHDHVEAEILYALLKGGMNMRALSMQLAIPEYVLEEYLSGMVKKDIIRMDADNYRIG